MEKFPLTDFTLEPQCLANKVILITGAGSGIGRSLALAAAKHGATCILAGKTLKKLEALYDEITTAGFPEPAIHPINLLRAEPQHAFELAQSIDTMFGRLDAVIHNAAITGQICQTDLLPPQQWQQVMQLNVNVPYLLTHALLSLLRKSDTASIVFTTADEALQGKAYWSAYSASKFGLLGFAQALHQELEENTTIRVNCINPGKVRTNLRARIYPGIDPMTWPAPEEIIEQYIYVLSDDAKAIRGKWIELAPIHQPHAVC